MLSTYREAFSATFFNETTGDDIQAVEVLDDSFLEEGVLRISVLTFWTDPITRVIFELSVPIVTPVRYDGDDGLFGHMVRLPSSRTQHWCHPLLVCPFAEEIAADVRKGSARFRYSKPEDWKFEWISWFGRVNRMVYQAIEALCFSDQQPTRNFVHTHFRRGLMDLITPSDNKIRPSGWQENGANNSSGLPITEINDDGTPGPLLFRHIHEMRLGYPDCPNNDELYEKIKHKYIEQVDNFCDVCWTGKNHTGREVGRVFEGDPVSFSTGRPMPRLGRALNPLMQHAEVKRVWREDRSCAGWLTIQNPIPPPLTAKGVSLPSAFANKVTTLVTAIIDIPNMNVYTATEQDVADFPGRVEEGEQISLDGILITPSGQKKMKAIVTTPEVKSAEEFFSKKEEMEELPGFKFDEDYIQVEILTDGTPVYNYQYRCSWDKPCRCRIDKVKCLCGGIKGVTMPIDQLYTEINGEITPIDIVVSERTALSKGARDMFLYPLLVHAGITDIDPTLTLEQLVEITTKGLEKKDLPTDGRFPIYSSKIVPVVNYQEVEDEVADCLEAMGRSTGKKSKKVLIGHSIVGSMPWVRAQEREDRQSSARQGMRLNFHARVLGGLDIPISEETESIVKRTADFFYDYSDIALAGAEAEPEVF